MGFRSSLNNFSSKKGRCIFIATITVAVQCNSKWQTASFKEGVKHCNNRFSSEFFIWENHYEEKLGDLVKKTAEESLKEGWVKEIRQTPYDIRPHQDTAYETVEYLYCPHCQKLEEELTKEAPS